MKKVILSGILTLASMIALSPLAAHAQDGMSVYPAAARVTAIHGDLITVTTSTGYVYEFNGDDYYIDGTTNV